jgi:peroxiredoxin
MPRAESSMMPLGTKAPIFDLPDTVSGKQLGYHELKGAKGLVIMFICNHCPYVIHIQKEMANIAKDFQSKGIGFVAISANDVDSYSADSPEMMKEFASENDFTFPYLYDESQEVAKAYQAECTPDFFLFDANENCVYRGRMDDSSPGNGQPVTGDNLRSALICLIEDLPIDSEQFASIGCSIKWKK